ncbi:major facilitator superfamily domain-containing protein [Aspergillus venezuelensis]
MATSIIRDSQFGQIVRVLTGRRILKYPEESSDETCKNYLINKGLVEETNRQNIWGLYTFVSACLEPKKEEVDGEEKEPDQNVVKWAGADDPDDPQNWSLGKKVWTTLMIFLLTFSVYLGSSIYSPGVMSVTMQFGVSQVAATLGLSLFVAGYGLGPMVWSPLSEVPAIGRNPVYIYTLLVFTFFQFAVVYAKNFGMLLAFRFLTGFLGSPVLATGGASLGDIWHPIIRDYMIAVWGAIAIAAPVIGPLIGGFASQAKGWTWTIWELLWLSGFTLVLLFIALPETYAPNILSRRARRLRRITGMKDLTTEAEAEFAGTPKQRILFETLLRPFMLCFTEPIVLVLDIYIALIYGIFYLWFEAFPIVFEEIHGFNLGEGGLSFLGILVACYGMAIPLYCGWKYFFQRKHYSEDGDIAPEKQLPPACVGCIALPISLFFFGWTGNYVSIHWIVPIVASMFFALGGCLIFYCVFTYLMGAYPKYAASVLAGNDFMRSCFGAGFPLFASAMFHNLGVNWACTLLGCLTVLFVPAPFVLLRLGRRLRMASKYARHDI